MAAALGAAALAGWPAAAQAPAAPEAFVDANETAGIDAPHRSSWAEFVHDTFTSGYLGIGQAWGDYDNDGWALGALGAPLRWLSALDGAHGIAAAVSP